jgi:hypothetical protein
MKLVLNRNIVHVRNNSIRFNSIFKQRRLSLMRNDHRDTHEMILLSSRTSTLSIELIIIALSNTTDIRRRSMMLVVHHKKINQTRRYVRDEEESEKNLTVVFDFEDFYTKEKKQTKKSATCFYSIDTRCIQFEIKKKTKHDENHIQCEHTYIPLFNINTSSLTRNRMYG